MSRAWFYQTCLQPPTLHGIVQTGNTNMETKPKPLVSENVLSILFTSELNIYTSIMYRI